MSGVVIPVGPKLLEIEAIVVVVVVVVPRWHSTQFAAELSPKNTGPFRKAGESGLFRPLEIPRCYFCELINSIKQ